MMTQGQAEEVICRVLVALATQLCGWVIAWPCVTRQVPANAEAQVEELDEADLLAQLGEEEGIPMTQVDITEAHGGADACVDTAVAMALAPLPSRQSTPVPLSQPFLSQPANPEPCAAFTVEEQPSAEAADMSKDACDGAELGGAMPADHVEQVDLPAMEPNNQAVEPNNQAVEPNIQAVEPASQGKPPEVVRPTLPACNTKRKGLQVPVNKAVVPLATPGSTGSATSAPVKKKAGLQVAPGIPLAAKPTGPPVRKPAALPTSKPVLKPAGLFAMWLQVCWKPSIASVARCASLSFLTCLLFGDCAAAVTTTLKPAESLPAPPASSTEMQHEECHSSAAPVVDVHPVPTPTPNAATTHSTPSEVQTAPSAPKPQKAAKKVSAAANSAPPKLAAAATDDTSKKAEKRPRAASGYQLWCNDMRVVLKETEPGLSMPETSKRLAEMWKGASDEEKAPFLVSWDGSHGYESVSNAKKKAKKGQALTATVTPAVVVLPSVPRRRPPASAFSIFMADRRPELKAEMPDASVLELNAALEVEWRNISEEEKASWVAEAQERAAAAEMTYQLATAQDAAGLEFEEGVCHDDPTSATDNDHGMKMIADAAARIQGPVIMGKRPAAPAPKPKGRKRPRKGAKGAKQPTQAEAEASDGDQQGQEDDEDHQITVEPEVILCHDNKGQYWVKMRGSTNLYDFKFVKADRVKQLRNQPAMEHAHDDGFNGWGSKLLELADQYEAYRAQFGTDFLECQDPQGGLVGAAMAGPTHPPAAMHISLNIDLGAFAFCCHPCPVDQGCLSMDAMIKGSMMDVCALLGTLRDKDAGGLLSSKPTRKTSAARGADDIMITVPAIMLSFVGQRMVNVWRDRALQAEAELAALQS
ncbi:uncharacterized protein HaLaN_03684 [Haematococcus lacustris]|uniref:HMG box domain-containing protein n=1 Tax=Haematococcus lacustris TaxID=44745 RepID=A0A699YF58_HAELA|nr:uncharacterized protein HaLaN_03684 [Haematococcus lacustris]